MEYSGFAILKNPRRYSSQILTAIMDGKLSMTPAFMPSDLLPSILTGRRSGSGIKSISNRNPKNSANNAIEDLLIFNKRIRNLVSMIFTKRIETPLGDMIAGATDEGICLLEFSDRRMLPTEYKDLARLLKTTIIEGSNNHIQDISKQLKEYFDGSRKKFSVPLVTPGTEFRISVWNELLNIEYGTVRSYQEQANALNCADSVRAVANANGMNRISIVIPCHRVIGSDGHLTGYGGGLIRKKWLLDHERKHSGKTIDLALF
jgi:AraC family transcriptional regulator, regulatory protein of adaptative response / methylated-DNA-[protein]-cysteine methyltransferase